MLQKAEKKIQDIIKEVISDDSQCFLCRSAAVGALIANVHMKGLTSDDILAQSDQISWTIFQQKVMSFTYPKVATCKGKVKPHVNLENRVKWCIYDSAFWGLHLEQY